MKFIKVLLILCFVSLSFSFTPLIDALAIEGNTRGPLFNVAVYGYCTGPNITKTYSAYVEMTGRISSVRTQLQMEDINSTNNSYVIYTYTDDNGYVTTPYYDGNYNSNSLIMREGANLGTCPNP